MPKEIYKRTEETKRMKKTKGQLGIGWMISGGIFLASIIFGGGKLYQNVDQVKSIQLEQRSIIQKLTDNETNILVILGKQEERLKFLERSK